MYHVLYIYNYIMSQSLSLSRSHSLSLSLSLVLSLSLLLRHLLWGAQIAYGTCLLNGLDLREIREMKGEITVILGENCGNLGVIKGI